MMIKYNNKYIYPNITKYLSLNDVFNDIDPYGYFAVDTKKHLSFNDIFSCKNVFIVAEPGNGKTRLLKEMVIRSGEFGKQGLFIDLKKVKGDLKDYILKNNKIIDELHKQPDIQYSALFKTKNFVLKNNAGIIICLDALDEVNHAELANAVDSIKKFTRIYNDISIIVSCRYYHLKKFQTLFIDFQYDYMKINLFSREQVCRYFNNDGIPKQNIEKIIQMVEFRNRSLVIQTQRYLEMTSSWIKNKGIKNLGKLTKTDLFEWFIYQKLDIEEKRFAIQKKEIIKQVLEKIALVMEIYQKNVLKKDELITIFDDIKSNINIAFLQQVPIEFFYERTVLKDNIDTIEFENTEFQEYLAAKEIIRLGKISQSVFDLAVDQDIQEIFPSWFNTLSFVVDLDIKLLKLLLDFGAAKNEAIQDEEYHRFLTKVDVDRLAIVERKEIFNNVFIYYQRVLHWMPFDLARNLSYYFDTSQNSLLKKSILVKNKNSIENFVKKGNVASILGFLLERNIIKDPYKKFWKNKLIEFAKDKNTNGVLQRHSLFALGKFKDIKLLYKIPDLRNSEDELILENFIESCIDINPNDDFSIDTFIIGAKKKNIYARYGLYQIREGQGIKKLLNYFAKDEQFLFDFIDQESIFKDRDHEIIGNIRNVWDDEIKNILDSVIIKAFSGQHWYLSGRSRFIADIISLLSEKDEDYLFCLLKSIKNNISLQKNLFSLEGIFALLLKKQYVEKFIKELSEIDRGKDIAIGTLRKICISKRSDAKKVYETGRRYLRNEYTQLEKYIKHQPQKPKEEKNTYNVFKAKLEPEKDKYDPGVFRYYLQNKDMINKYITMDDKKRLEHLMMNSIFDKFDPGQQKLTVTKKENGGGTSYTTHAWIHIFGDCLIIAEELSMDISKFRRKIIQYIPFAYSEHLKAIFSLIENPNAEEISSLLTIYNGKRKDDLPHFMPSSLIDVCEFYKISNAISILKGFVNEVQLSIYDRKRALEVVTSVNADRVYLEKIFKKYKKRRDNTVQLAEEANKYLIEKFPNALAIKWRIKRVQERASPFVKSKGTRWVSSFKNELWDKKFAKPLVNFKDPKYKKDYLNLLNTSFDLLEKGNNYYEYASYLWEIVISYFENLKETRSYKHIKDLETYIDQHSLSIGINWFTGKLSELKKKYMDYIGKPQNISECIKHYNKWKDFQYLNIATPKDLIDVIKCAISEDLTNFVEKEGFYKSIIQARRNQEPLIQKTLKTQLENALLKKGFRKNEVNIRREEQLLDDKRTDFLVSYGFIGPILIEIKRTDNKEINTASERKKYKTKLLQYLEGCKAHYGLFILFQIKKQYPISKYLPLMKKLYNKCKLIEITGLNCVKFKAK